MNSINVVIRRIRSKSFWEGFDLVFSPYKTRRYRPRAARLARDLNRSLEQGADGQIHEVWNQVGTQIEGAIERYGEGTRIPTGAVDRASKTQAAELPR